MRLLAMVLLIVIAVFPVRAQQAEKNLSSMSLEDLLQVRVTSVSKEEEPLSKAAAAIYVITQEDIRRSGATSIPEALRMVPGLDVAQMDGSTWAIGARGFNSQYASYMLVLVDGRTVYTPTTNGVYWDVQDTILEDVDRIEVICGPGAALWGENAVDGVINIITKKASATQGALVSVVAGSRLTPDISFRHGAKAGNRGFYRISGKYFDEQPGDLPAGFAAIDGAHESRIAFRGDWDLSLADSLTVQAQGYDGLNDHSQMRVASIVPPLTMAFADPEQIGGTDAMVKWSRTFSPRSNITLQTYYDYSDRVDPTRAELRDTADLDFQHRFAIKDHHDLTWGLGFRYTIDHTSGSFFALLDPRVSLNNTESVFAQDEITILPDRLRFTLGARFTHDNYSGSEIQPDTRLLWSLRSNHSIWAAVSRPVSEPSFAAFALHFPTTAIPGPNGLTLIPSLVPNPEIGDTHSLVVQLGYRMEVRQKLSIGISVFNNRYKGVENNEPGAPFLSSDPEPVHLVLPLKFENSLKGDTRGLELTASWQVNPKWRLSANYTFLSMSMCDVLTGALAAFINQESPRHQFQAHSFLDLGRGWEWDVSSYYVAALPVDSVPSYDRVDTRIGWRVAERAEVSFVGQNLLQPRHFEFAPAFAKTVESTEVRRSAYAKVTWAF